MNGDEILIRRIVSEINADLSNTKLRLFLGFRHVVRQAYGFQLDESKLE